MRAVFLLALFVGTGLCSRWGHAQFPSPVQAQGPVQQMPPGTAQVPYTPQMYPGQYTAPPQAIQSTGEHPAYVGPSYQNCDPQGGASALSNRLNAQGQVVPNVPGH